jgi:hypothetical protein
MDRRLGRYAGMNTIHIILGWGIGLAALATVVTAFLPNVNDELFDNLAATTVGLLIIQVVVGFFMFTAQDTKLNFFHLALPVAAGAALLGARSTKGAQRKTLVAVAAGFVVAAAIFSYLTGLASVSARLAG